LCYVNDNVSKRCKHLPACKMLGPQFRILQVAQFIFLIVSSWAMYCHYISHTTSDEKCSLNSTPCLPPVVTPFSTERLNFYRHFWTFIDILIMQKRIPAKPFVLCVLPWLSSAVPFSTEWKVYRVKRTRPPRVLTTPQHGYIIPPSQGPTVSLEAFIGFFTGPCTGLVDTCTPRSGVCERVKRTWAWGLGSQHICTHGLSSGKKLAFSEYLCSRVDDLGIYIIQKVSLSS
jgi:hypothetical protein